MAQSVAPRSGIDLCAMFDHRVAIVGDQLFFMSGTYIFEVAIMASRQPNLMWLDLNTTFPVETFIANASIGLSHIPSYDPAQDSGGSFFYDNTTVYVFAGLGDVDHVITNQLKSYNASAKNWSDVAVAGGNFNRGSRFKGLHTSDPGTGRSWYSGGFDTNIRGMIQFDSSVSTGPTWTNTTSVMTEISGANNLGGELVFVPMGQAGVLIAIGGYDTSQPGTQYNGSDLNFNNVPLNRISVYDIYSSTWYGVNATGDTPSQRVEFCSSVSPSPDLSSFQITIYGGFDMKVPRAFEDIYVLSIPSFRWIKVNDASNPGNAEYTNSNVGRQGHKCVLWKDSQMIVLGGGIKIGPNDGNAQGCNTDYPPIKVLNTANFTWQSRFDPKGAAYEVPKVVYDVIGGESVYSV
ncbi:MAG: hypothetical protein M1829_005325 [Trizodia sp. TS-e1964]|nr:MAG: hypothetical protein M1829_005325 [Trizodia sp. TS-e1964]